MYTENNLVYEDFTKQILISCADKLIESITIPPTVQKIKQKAFKDCVLLKDVNFGSGEKLSFELRSFPESSIKSLTLNERIKDFILLNGPAYFRDCINLENLKVINIPASYELFYEDLNPFFLEDKNRNVVYGDSIQAINIEKADYTDYSVDGIWCCEENDNESFIVFYPPAKKDKVLKIPENIINGFIEHNPYVEKIIFPKNYNFHNVFSPVTDCKSLTTIVYEGPLMDFTNFFNIDYFEKCPNFKNIIVSKKTMISKSTLDLIKRYHLNLSYDIINLDDIRSFKELNNLFKER